ncbi:MAG: right-handed parallel beta-helix repeat-containing protein [Planctomycetota bacterium]|jgi:parallel beta-helix repeat protein
MLHSHHLLIVAVVGLFAFATAADTIYVDDNNCPGPGSGTEANPYCSIQTAIDNAVDTDEIVVAPGTYFETINFLGKAVWLHSSDGPEVTIIDAQMLDRVVIFVSGEGPDTILDGFTIRGGNATGVFPDNVGGGMFNDANSSPTVSNCTFRGNTASSGGGMYILSGSPTVTDCTFSGNTVSNAGGGMFNSGGTDPTVTNCTFSENSARNAGGMSNSNSSPTVTTCTFSANTASNNGGGMFNGGGSDPTVTNCTFSGNTAGSSGGGMFNITGSSPMVNNCTFSGNTASNNGGGLYNQGSDPTLSNCAFSLNEATRGGGMYNAVSSPTVTNCTFSGNTANDNGGGVRNSINSNPTVTNCILWADSPDEIVGGTPAVSYTDVQGSFPGTGNIDADPMFVDAGNGDYHLVSGSPAIDAGDNTAVPLGITTDLDGNPRFVDDPDTLDTGNGDPPVVDMGAYEYQIPCPWDLDSDGNVNVVDLLIVIANWGPCEDCPADFNDDGFVNVLDLLALIGNWGPCPGVPCVWDVTGDGVVDQSDLHQVQENFGPCDGCPEDVNGDGFVNGQDAAAVATHYGPCP